jgi:hypothetical protein
MRIVIAFALCLVPGNACLAQQVGSAAGYAAIAGAQRAAMEQEAEWNAAKKLSVLPLPVGLKPSNGSDGLDIDKLSEGQVEKMDYWDFRVLSIVDDKNLLLQLGTSRTFWLEGFPTKDLVDNQSVRLIGPIEIRGTKEYTTAIGGLRTVRVLRFVSEDRVRNWEKEEADRKGAEEQAKEEAMYQTWHSKAGTQVVAKFIDWRSGKVELLTKDGRKLSVPVSALTDDDAEKARELNRQMRAKK